MVPDSSTPETAAVLTRLFRARHQLRTLCGVGASLALVMLGLAAAAPAAPVPADLDALITYETRQVTATGVTRTETWQERLIRRGDTVWTERVLPAQLVLLAMGFLGPEQPYLDEIQWMDEPVRDGESARAHDGVAERDRLVVVHGRAGIGKSGTLIALVNALRERDIDCLPIRLWLGPIDDGPS